MTTSHRIIVTLEADDCSTDAGGGNSGLLVEAVPNPLLAETEGSFVPGDQVTWHFTGLKPRQRPLVMFHRAESDTEGDPRGPFETLSVGRQRIVGSGDSGVACPPLFYSIFVIDRSSPEALLIQPRWKNPLPDLRFGGLEPPKIPP